MPNILAFNGSITVEGDTKMAIATLRALSAQGSVRVLSVPGPAADALKAESVEVVCAPSSHKAIQVVWMAATALRLMAAEPTLCLYTYDRTFAVDVALNCTALISRRCIFHVHMPFVVEKTRRYALAQKCAEIWHISQFVKDESARRGLKGGRVVLNCLPEEPPKVTREEARQASGVVKHPSAVLVGRLSPYKGQETFIRAFRVLKDRGVELSGYLIGYDTGEGRFDSPPRADYRAYLESLIRDLDVSDRVELLGKRPGHAAFRAADIACALSDEEPFGLVIAEAVMADCAVLATRAGAFPELISDERTGLLIPIRNPSATADALTLLASRADKRAEFARAAHAELRQPLSFERFRNDVLEAVASSS